MMKEVVHGLALADACYRRDTLTLQQGLRTIHPRRRRPMSGRSPRALPLQTAKGMGLFFCRACTGDPPVVSMSITGWDGVQFSVLRYSTDV